MRDLNYHHLRHFWALVRTGSVAGAARLLGCSQPTVSGQLRLLQGALGTPLLERRGRRLVPTAAGQTAYRYAEEIFDLGRDLVQAVRESPAAPRVRFTVGVSDALPKLTTVRLLEPVVRLREPVHLVVRIGRAAELVPALANGGLDLVLADEAVPAAARVRATSHLLVESGVTIFALADRAARWRRAFPRSLHGAPFLLQTSNTALRRSLEAWFTAEGVRPQVVAEVEDVALLQGLGGAGAGLFAAPTLVEDDIRRQYGVRRVGRLESVRERFYAITAERRPRHPAALAMLEGAPESV